MKNPTIQSTESPAPRLGRMTRGLRALFLSALSALVVWLTAGTFLYMFPQEDEPIRADVIFVLGPPDERVGYAKELMLEGYAHTLAVSVPLDRLGRFDSDICDAPASYRIICFYPEPFTTQGEARALRQLSQENEWHSANVLTTQFHLSRARYIVEQCFGPNLRMVAFHTDRPLISIPNPKDSWAYQYAYQTVAFAKAAWSPAC